MSENLVCKGCGRKVWYCECEAPDIIRQKTLLQIPYAQIPKDNTTPSPKNRTK